jgi:hypothetical protein
VAVAIRPTASGDAEAADAKDGWKSESVHTNFTLAPYDATPCPAYNRWPFGLENRASGYTAKLSDEQLKKQLISGRPHTYSDRWIRCRLGGFDSSCGAMAQGPTRRARGEAFLKFVNETLGAKHKAIIVSECGHNDRCVYTTDAVLPVIFPK